MVTYYYPPQFSGTGTQACELAKALHALGCRIHVVTSRWGASGQTEEVDGLVVHRLPPRGDGRVGQARWVLRLIHYLIKHRDAFDVVHFHSIQDYLVVGAFARRALRKPVIYKPTLMGFDDPVSVVKGGWRGKIHGWLLSQTNAIVCPSPAVVESAADAGVPPGAVVYIPNGVDLTRFWPLMERKRRAAQRAELGVPSEALVGVCLGAVVARKRVELLIQAWPLIVETYGSAYLLLVGPTEGGNDNPAFDSSYVAGLRNLVDRSGLTDVVRWIGPTAEVASYLQIADVFLLASSTEGLPNALLEAVACGVPPCVVKIDGITDAVIQHGANGLIVEQPDPKDIAEAVGTLFADRDKRRAMGQAARKTAEEQYDIRAIAEQYCTLYCRLVNDQQGLV